MSEDFLNQIEDDGEDLYRFYVKPVHPVVSKIAVWLFILGGIAIGTCLFLFFLTLFIYLFLPAMAIFLIWFAYKKWKFNRTWQKVEKNFYNKND